MEVKLYKGMFDVEEVPLFGVAAETVKQAPNELKYWLNGYAFYKREDGQFFVQEFEEEYKEQFYWNICGYEPDFDHMLEELDESYIQAVEKLEKLTDLGGPYGVAPISFETALSEKNEPVVRNLVFVTATDSKYFEVKSTSDFYNITTNTATQLKEFEENSLANPHKIMVDESGNVEARV